MFTTIISKISNLISKCGHYIDSSDGFVLNNKKLKATLFILSLLLFGGIIFLFNYKTFLQWDDFKLVFIWPERIFLDNEGFLNNPTERVMCFKDILISQYNHYFTWGGRTVVHIIAQFLLYIDPLKADVLNTLMYLVYVLLIYYHIIAKGKHDVLLFVGINFMVWILQPVFSETILWLTGSANYLWGTSIVLMFLLPFRLYDNQRLPRQTFVKCIGMLVLGVIAGWTNENTAAATIFAAFIFLLYFYSQKWRVPTWAILGIAGALIGYIIMISAPGNLVRADLRTSGVSLDVISISRRFLTSTQMLFQYLGAINLFGFILFLLFRQYSKEDENYKRISFLFITYFATSLVAVYVMIFSPFFPPRAWFGAITFNTISFGILFYNINYNIPFIRYIRQATFLVGLFLFVPMVYDGHKDLNKVYKVWIERDAILHKQKETGIQTPIHWTYTQTKFALSDPPFLENILTLYYDTDVKAE